MSWAKISCDLHNNPKVRMAGREAREVYLFVLLCNARQKADGEISEHYVSPDYLADQLQCSGTEAMAGLTRACQFGLLLVQNGVCKIVGWDSSWRVKLSADRMAKHRKKKKEEKESMKPDTNNDVTSPMSHVISSDGVTVVEENRREQKRTEQKRETIVVTPEMLDELYRLYPLKKGRVKGLAKLAKTIKTLESYEAVLKCVTWMNKAWEPGSNKKFVKHFSTFANQEAWLEDWQAPDGTTPGNVTAKDIATKYQDLTDRPDDAPFDVDSLDES